jgi:signal-transduction protein with cAMP-binding, CBS, and nucleotidyltransferase domain
MAVVYAVRNMMTENIISVEALAALNEAVEVMVEKGIGSVVVTRDGEMVGILTERDVLKKFCLDSQCAIINVGEVMSSPLITIDGGATLGEAADLMAEKKIRRLAVTENGKIRGLITERDVMRATLDVFRKLAHAWI